MKNEGKKTGIFAGVAAVLVLLAVATMPRAKEAAVFSSQGGEFYPAFKDPLKVAALEVMEPEELGTFKPFRVQVVDGQWSIPSHSNYPADGKDRLAKTAASVMDLKKERLASDNPKDYEELGVGDPQDVSLQGKKGRGKRVRLFDSGGSILADYIFGKETKEGADYRYVRVPDQKQTWAVKVKPDISVKFEDWVETDLLKLGSASIRKVLIDKYSVDTTEMKIKDRASYAAARDDSGSAWKVSEMKETEEANTETLTTLTSTLSGLKLTGVRKKPDAVAQAQDLRNLGKMPRELLVAIARTLAGKGFIVYSEDKNTYGMISSEGEMQLSCDDGVVYTLRFGDVLVGAGDEVSAGVGETDESDPKDPKKDGKKDAKAGSSENRYLMVSAAYDESLVGSAPVEPKPYVADPAKKPEEQKAEEEKAKKEKDDYETKKKDREKKKADGKKRAEDLTKRFAPWYYVISADAFKKLRVERSALVKVKEVPKDEKKPEDKKPEPPKDEKKAEPSKDDKKPEAPKEEKKPDAPKGEKKPEDKKPDEKKSDPPKPDDKKPEEKKP
ncbi:MAG TPA: DUF4340 domain-containing protein [Planctomycetota bacterium]|nr:DUF4340 domain-containing protein [Planctomycetota bacterium]